MFYGFFFTQKAAYELRISDWSSDVCSSDLVEVLVAQDDVGGHAIGLGALEAPGTQLIAGMAGERRRRATEGERGAVVGDPLAEAHEERAAVVELPAHAIVGDLRDAALVAAEHRSEEHTSELQSLMRISYAVFSL